MPVAEIITIGTELLLGEIHDTNTAFLARAFRDVGIDLFRTTTIGDNPVRIAQVIREAMARADIIVTTGGLGPTIDDPTRQAVADAVGREVEFVPALWDQVQARFQRFGRTATENNKRQAYIPVGAIPVENPVGTAPAFIFETDLNAIISLPGVPKEMEYLLESAVLPYLQHRYQLKGTIKAVVLHLAAVGESQIDELIGDFEAQSNPTVGLAAHPGQIDVRVTAKADTLAAADAMIAGVVVTLRERLGDWIYGQDEETLTQVVIDQYVSRGLTCSIVETGLAGLLIQELAGRPDVLLSAEREIEALDLAVLSQRTHAIFQDQQPSIALGAALHPHSDRHHLDLVVITKAGAREMQRFYGSAPQNAAIWAVNVCLDMLRRTVLTHVD